MFRTGLVSVTFRRMSPSEILKLVVDAKLRHIEWGGDVHVPPGSIDTAKNLCRQMDDAGLKTAAYGSYYRVASTAPQRDSFDVILETAVALEAPVIRIWAGDTASENAADSRFEQVASETRAIAEKAKAAGIRIAFEYHGNTLNDTPDSCRRLLKMIGHENVGTFWQTDVALSPEANRNALKRIRKWLLNIHAFHWQEGVRRTLDEGYVEWGNYLEMAATTERDHVVLIEFVQHDSTRAFAEDAETLRRMVRSVNKSRTEE